MEKTAWPSGGLETSRIIYGCMGLDSREKAFRALDAAADAGIDAFDHADIYCRGDAERFFGEWLGSNRDLRSDLFIQSKCGIHLATGESPAMYDFSCDHILYAVEGILGRLGTDYLDLLLLHRPDPLVEPGEVARAFDLLHRMGRVRNFGVSNHSAAQIELLRGYLDQPIVANQMEISLVHHDLLSSGILVGRDGGTVEYCRGEDIALQAWSPLAGGRLSGAPLQDASPAEVQAAELVVELAADYGTGAGALVLAWLLRHPAAVFPVIGTTAPERIREAAAALDINMDRKTWYSLLQAVRGKSVP